MFLLVPGVRLHATMVDDTIDPRHRVSVSTSFGSSILSISATSSNGDQASVGVRGEGRTRTLHGLEFSSRYHLTIKIRSFFGTTVPTSLYLSTYQQTELVTVERGLDDVSVLHRESTPTITTTPVFLIYFSERIDPSSTSLFLAQEDSTAAIALEVEWSDVADVATATVPVRLEHETTYVVLLGQHSIDVHGMPVHSSQPWRFITVKPLNLSLASSTVHPTSATLEFVASAGIREFSMSTQTINLSGKGSFSLEHLDEMRFRVQLKDLSTSTRYTLSFGDGILGANGSTLDTTQSFSFTTPRRAVSAPPTQPIAIEGKAIVIDKTLQRVTLYDSEDVIVQSFTCSSGRLYPRTGTYRIFAKKPNSQSIYDNSRFSWFSIFQKSDKGNNIGFHSVPVYPDGTLAEELGQPISHGCVRLSYDAAKFLYDWAPVGTVVIVR